MSDRLDCGILKGAEGELVTVRVYAGARSLEEVLDALAGAAFPINPEIRHASPLTVIEFPAYDRHLDEIRNLLSGEHLAGTRIEIRGMLAAIR